MRIKTVLQTLSVACLMLLLCGCGGGKATVRPGYEPVTLLKVDSDMPLDMEQQKERLRLARILKPRFEDGKFVMGHTRREAARLNVAGPYYDYVEGLMSAFNAFLERNPDMKDASVEGALEKHGSLEMLATTQYIRFDGDYNVVYDLTPELAAGIGLTEEQFRAVDEVRMQEKAMVTEFMDKQKEAGIPLSNFDDLFLLKTWMFVPLQDFHDDGCCDGCNLRDETLDRELKELDVKYSRAGEY